MPRLEAMGDFFDNYASLSDSFDELFAGPGDPRSHYAALYAVLGTLSDEEYSARCHTRDNAFRDQGVTFSFSGEERPFPLDLVPRIIPADEWTTIEAGVAQRVRALEAFLADIYSSAHVVADGIVPRRLVVTSSQFRRQAAGVRPPNGVRIHVAGIDLVRDPAGRYVVLEDNVRTPSGISYVIENRRAMTHVFPGLFTSHRVRPVADIPTRLLEALRSSAPRGVDQPTVVLLTPGVANSAYFEHVFLARQMGVELVEGRDLICRDSAIYMRTTEGEARVDVVYRRIDDDYLDPLHFRPESLIGCPGILGAERAGNVAIANGVGNGVGDDKVLFPYVPKFIEYYLGETPILANVPTYDLDDPDQLAFVVDHLDSLVCKPADGSGGHGLVIGPAASELQLVALRQEVLANPRGWIAQDVVRLSTSPTYVDGAFGARHVDLRPFAINDGQKVWVAAGGLTRVALPKDSLVVNSSQGGGSKDTWVLANAAGEVPAPRPQRRRATLGEPARAPDRGPVGAAPESQQ
jgi:uncharacterized circularly permuted ATP-grasp superfamily protein